MLVGQCLLWDGGACYARPVMWIPPQFTHTCTHMHKHMQTHVHVQTQRCTHAQDTQADAHKHMHTHAGAHVHVCTSTQAHTGTHAHTRTHNADMHRCMHTCVCMRIPAQCTHVHAALTHEHTHVHSCRHAWTHSDPWTHTHLSPSLLPRARRAFPWELCGWPLASAWTAQGPLGPPSGCQYLSLWRLERLPAVLLQLVQLAELHADILHRQLQHVPVPGQVLRRRSGYGAGVLRTHAEFAARKLAAGRGWRRRPLRHVPLRECGGGKPKCKPSARPPWPTAHAAPCWQLNMCGGAAL